MADSDTEDERETELDSIKAIFDELRSSPEDPYTAFLDIPVTPEAPLPIVFPTVDGAPPNQLPTPPSSDHDATVNKDAQLAVEQTLLETHRVSHLPSLKLQITLPKGYPSDQAPQFVLSTDPSWIPDDTLKNLQLNGLYLWHEYGHGQVVFAYIDQLQQSAERAFGLAVDGPLPLSPNMRIALLDFDRKTARQKFEAETFDCGVCLEPKKGAVCHRITRCCHVFCVSCLQDFYNTCITEGDIGSVRCLAPDCGADSPRGRKPKTLSPSQLLQIPLEHDMVKRYVDLKRKKKLESDTTTIYCPRKWCQGPARSTKYPKLTDIAAIDSSESSDDEAPTTTTTKKDLQPPPSERLAICSVCQYAFCRTCNLGWHGEYVHCLPRDSAGELSAEDQASFDYIRLNTSPCPTCAAPCQKTHGCNHMSCFQCATHFCYLCSTWLDAGNPYTHFNQRGKGCYLRLWELEEGDNGQGGAFGGVRMAEHEAFALEQQLLEADVAAEEGVDDAHGVGQGEMDGGAEAPWLPAAPAPPLQADIPAVVVMMNQVNLQGRPPQQQEFVQRAQQRGPPRRNRVPGPQPRRGRQRGGGVGAGANRGGQQGQGQVDAYAQRNNGIRRFLDMAEVDEEDGWDSDELSDDDDWAIPAR